MFVLMLMTMLAMPGFFVRGMFVSFRNDSPPRRLLGEINGCLIVLSVQGRLPTYSDTCEGPPRVR